MTSDAEEHGLFMAAALEQAHRGLAAGEVPIGAVLVVNGEIIARAFNQPISAIDPTAHAEVLVLRAAAQAIGNYRLTDAAVYVTGARSCTRACVRWFTERRSRRPARLDPRSARSSHRA
jgi:tRNA(adenine34) deaminase